MHDQLRILSVWLQVVDHEMLNVYRHVVKCCVMLLVLLYIQLLNEPFWLLCDAAKLPHSYSHSYFHQIPTQGMYRCFSRVDNYREGNPLPPITPNVSTSLSTTNASFILSDYFDGVMGWLPANLVSTPELTSVLFSFGIWHVRYTTEDQWRTLSILFCFCVTWVHFPHIW